MPEQIRNVIVFGDSLSDIGIMAQTGLGKFAKAIGEMTVNSSKRFSDNKNWADFMYEAATGQSLMKATPQLTIAASQQHTTLKKETVLVGTSRARYFRYANYAKGGACGGIPHDVLKKSLGEFKEQVEAFTIDWRQLTAGQHAHAVQGTTENLTLFIVWFGANDLYTAGSRAMGGVAEKVANKRRNELAEVVGRANARFIFVNLGHPMAAVRYQERAKKRSWYESASGPSKAEKEIETLRLQAMLYNYTLGKVCAKNGDTVVDMASVISPYNLVGLLSALGLIEGAQNKANDDANYNFHGKAYRADGELVNTTTKDEVHPTQRVYELMWTAIFKVIQKRGYTFGNLPGYEAHIDTINPEMQKRNMDSLLGRRSS